RPRRGPTPPPYTTLFRSSPDPTDFGSRQTGTTSDAVTYTITNTGGADLGLDSIEFVGGDTTQFDRTRSTRCLAAMVPFGELGPRSEEHTSDLQSRRDIGC